jgi:general secretion pathway protein K
MEDPLRPTRHEDGFALLAVLWLLVVLGMLVLQFHRAAHADRGAAINGRDAARALWTARGGLAQALDRIDRTLARPYAYFAAPAGGEHVLPPIQLTVDGIAGTVWMLDSRARLNLNLADEPELTRLVLGAGIPPDRAAHLVDAILDWRDPDEVPRARGAETERYRTRRPPALPRNARFESVEELREVWSVGSDDYRLLAPHLTVHGDGRVNVNTASLPVLLSLPGVDLRAARQIIARRATRRYSNVYEVLAELPYQGQQAQDQAAILLDHVAFSPRTIEILSAAAPAGSRVQAEVRAVVELVGGDRLSIVYLRER